VYLNQKQNSKGWHCPLIRKKDFNTLLPQISQIIVLPTSIDCITLLPPNLKAELKTEAILSEIPRRATVKER